MKSSLIRHIRSKYVHLDLDIRTLTLILYYLDVLVVTHLLRLKAHVTQSALEEQRGWFSKNFSFHVAGVLWEKNRSALKQR